jgi:hypothetical protein
MSLYRYVERIANVRWELKDLGMEHNGYAISSCRMCISMVCRVCRGSAAEYSEA